MITLRGAQQRDRLERSRAELVSTVAHELRSPLTSVKGFTATLLTKWARFTDDQKRVMLETVNADADRVTRLITELLDVSRIESGRMEVHRQLVDVPDRARKIIAGRVAAGDAEDRFRLEVLDGLPETWLDADKIDQILGNLVENAVRHGAGIVTIVVEPARWRARRRSAATRSPCPCATRARASRPRWPPGCSASSGAASAVAAAARGTRRHRPRPVHRQGPRRGARRHDQPWAARPAAAPSSDLPCPRGRLSPERDTAEGTEWALGTVISLRAIQHGDRPLAVWRGTLKAGPTLPRRRVEADAALPATPVRQERSRTLQTPS